MELYKKCSLEEEKEIKAVCFCQECRVYMCNKCENTHLKLFKNYHHCFKLDKDITEIFTGFCQEAQHNEKLEYFCKNHNKLCCVSCICKIKGKGKGSHSDCNVCFVEDIKEEKKNQLKNNLKNLEELSKEFEKSLNELKEMMNKINENKENLKLEIQKIFTKLRNVINEREDELLIEVDRQFDEIYFNENIIKESEKLPNKIKSSIEKGKNIKEINKINESMKKCNDSKYLKVNIREQELNTIINSLQIFGKIYISGIIFNDSLIINKNNIYIENLISWINSTKKFKTEFDQKIQNRIIIQKIP